MEKAYQNTFEGLAEGEEKLRFNEFRAFRSETSYSDNFSDRPGIYHLYVPEATHHRSRTILHQ